MKRLTAILFLLLLLFNLFGYRLWFSYLQQKADAELVAQLDEEAYDDSSLIELKVPLSLPYQTDWKGFERVDGEIEIEGKIYKYVKRKMVNGELVVLCLPDPNKARFENAREEFFKLANDLQTGNPVKKGSEHQSFSIKQVLSDYEELQQAWSLDAVTPAMPPHYAKKQFTYPSAYHCTPEQPPEA